MTKKLVQISILLLVATRVIAQSDQDLLVSQAFSAKTIGEIEQLTGKQKFSKIDSVQLNWGITQTNWVRRRGRKGKVGLITLSSNGRIFYADLRTTHFDPDLDTNIFSSLSVKRDSTFAIPNFNPDDLEPLFGSRTFGYACGASAALPFEGSIMMDLVKEKDLEALEDWLYSINPVKQAYSYLGFSVLQANGLELDAAIMSEMAKAKDSKLLIYYCSGCETWEPRQISEILADVSLADFIARHQE